MTPLFDALLLLACLSALFTLAGAVAAAIETLERVARHSQPAVSPRPVRPAPRRRPRPRRPARAPKQGALTHA